VLNLESHDRPKRLGEPKKISRLILGACATVTVVILGSTFASNISLNNSIPVQFGQGVASSTACDSDITVMPLANFVNVNGGGTFNFNSVELSGINSDSSHCLGKSFEIKAFGTGSSPLTLYGTSTSLIICDRGSNFVSYSPTDYPVTSTDGTGFSATIAAPVASSLDVKRLTVESASKVCNLGAQTYNQDISVPSDPTAQVNINNALPNNKLAADGFTGRVRGTITVDCGNVRITTTSGLSTVYGYQSPIDDPASSIAFEGTVARVNAALDSLVYNRASCSGNQELTGSISQAASDENAPISYNPDNGHYYQYISTEVTWDAAFNRITGSSLAGTDGYSTGIQGTYNLNRSYASCYYKFNGMCGYMATVSSESEDLFVGNKVGNVSIWLGGTDRREPGTWVWEDDRSPEYGTAISTLGTTGGLPDPFQISASYSNWGGGEPNGYGGDPLNSGETAIQTLSTPQGVAPTWNNLHEAGPTLGYLVEYGGSPVDTGGGDEPQTHIITLHLG
jgi:hypothetical protein